MKFGVSKSAAERNCTELSGTTVEQHKGGHSYSEFKKIAEKDVFEKKVEHLTSVLIKVLRNEHRDPAERKQFMNGLLNWASFNSVEAEAVRRVYKLLYGEPSLNLSGE